MRLKLTPLLFILTLFSYSNNPPSCKDFKNGIFHVKPENESEFFYTLERTDNTQIEKSIYGGDKTYYIIEWINECSYIQKFDDTKMKLTKEMKMVNSDGGMVVELLEIKNDSTISFQSYVKDFKEMSLTHGVFTKVKK